MFRICSEAHLGSVADCLYSSEEHLGSRNSVEHSVELSSGSDLSSPYLYNNAPNQGPERNTFLPYTQIESLSNATRPKTRPVLVWGSHSDSIPNTPANMRQRSPLANVALVDSSKKKPECSNRGHRY